MATDLQRSTSYGGWLMSVAGLVGLLLSALNYLNQGNGIAYSAGAALVFVSSALVFAASLVMVLDHDKPAWLLGFLYVSLLLGLIGTALAAYFLEAYWLMGAMIVGLIGWIIRASIDPTDEEIARHAIRKEVLS